MNDDKKLARVMQKVEIDSEGCWIYKGHHSEKGYGLITVAGKKWAVHRLIYSLLVDDLIEGQEVHHTCEDPSCVNPQHLIQLSHTDHNKMHYGGPYCKRGHLKTPERYKPDNKGSMACLDCLAELARQYRRDRQVGIR